MYKFSAPMPYTIEDISKLLEINKEVKKSKIVSLYFSLPETCELYTGFEQNRNFQQNFADWTYWKDLIQYALSKNTDIIYLLNYPYPLDLTNKYTVIKLEKLEKLLTELRKTSVNKLRICDPRLITYINKYFPDFDIYASCSLEYKTINEYKNFLEFHPNVKQIVPSHDLNKNFKLLSSLKKLFPDIEIELIVNEGCMKGCPNRNFHPSCSGENIILNNDIVLSSFYYGTYCHYVEENMPVENLISGNLIFPWDINEYGKLGITKFKFVGRDSYLNDFKQYLYGFYNYLKGIDNIKNIENFHLAFFTHKLKYNKVLKQLKIKDYKKYLPNINYFRKYGHLCTSKCSAECFYCYKCAEKIKQVFDKKEVKARKSSIPICEI